MNRSTVFSIGAFALILGILLCAIQYEWIVIRFYQQVSSPDIAARHTRKKVNIYYWHNQQWHKEAQEIIWSTHLEKRLETLVSSWLSLIDAERLIPKKVLVQTAMLAPNKQDAFISLDRSPFAKSWSIQKKLQLIESMLKTVRENNSTIMSIQFLIDHQPMSDPHLDFSRPWPISGFMQS